MTQKLARQTQGQNPISVILQYNIVNEIIKIIHAEQ